MKKIILFIQILIFSCVFVACSSVEDNVIDGEDEAPKAVNIDLKTAGSMDAYLADNKLKGVESLVLTGEMNVLDFIALKALPELKALDLTNVKIVEYTGTTPYDDAERTYSANSFELSFMANPSEASSQHFPFLTTLDLPNTLEVIGVAAFVFNKTLKHIVVPESVHTIVDMAFSDCESLESVVLPKNYTGELVYTFSGCRNLKSVNIPVGVSRIHMAFLECDNLLSLDIPYELNLGLDSWWAFGEAGMKEVRIPKSMTDIPECAFVKCKNLESVIFHENVKKIRSGAFSDCPKIKSFNFVAPIEWTYVTALAVGPQLEEIHFKNTTPPKLDSDIPLEEWASENELSFVKNNFGNCTLYIPQGSKDAYLKDMHVTFWKMFKEIVEE